MDKNPKKKFTNVTLKSLFTHTDMIHMESIFGGKKYS